MSLRKISSALCLFVCGTIIAGAQTVAPTPATPPAPPPAGAPATAPRLLRQLLIADTVEELQKMPAQPGAPFVVLSASLSAFDAAELNKRLATGENRPIEEKILAAIAQVVEVFIRQGNYPTAAVIVPTQNIADGVVRLLVQLGDKAVVLTPASELKIRKINMQGARWFSESLLREKLRIEQGGKIRISDLDQALSWTNSNPFRMVKVHLEPVPNTGEADLTIAVQDTMPLRFTGSIDNTGNEVIGRERFVASVNYANLWGRDHQVAYQYITTTKPDVFQGHGLDYRVPLPWRHYVGLSASYIVAKPSLYEGLFEQKGETITSDLRYTIPLRTGENTVEVFGGFSFKESNNNLTWDPKTNPVQVLATKTDVFQFTFGGSLVRRDKRGGWAFGAGITASPGGFNSRNRDEAYDAGRFTGGDSARIGAKARYMYGSFSVQRLLKVSEGWDIVSRGMVQLSEANLLPSEQLSIGGSSTVRGYNESIFAGDHGYVFSTELLFPSLKFKLGRLSTKRGPLESRFLVFFDAAHTGVRHRYPSDFKRAALMSEGVGLRTNLANNFSLVADYGWQLSDLPYPVEEKSRGHIKAVLAF